MATKTIHSTLRFARFARHGACMALTLAVLFLAVQASTAQELPSPSQTRDTLNQGIDLYKAHDYEQAAQFFAFAQAGRQFLQPAQQKDLTEFSMQNDIALKGRRDGLAQLQLAQEALKSGRTQDAGNLLKSLNSNQYLNPTEREQVNELGRKMQSQANAAGQQPGKADAKSLLAAGRAALQAGDLAKAEALAKEADKASSLLSNWFQTDSPAKLNRDIQTAKAKIQAPPTVPTGPELMPKNPEVAANDPNKTAPSKFMGMTIWPFGGSAPAPAKKDEMSPDGKAGMARQMVKDGFFFLEQANQIDMARMCAMKAKELNVTFGPNEQTPDMLLHEIQRRTAGVTKPAPEPTTPTAKKETPTPAPTLPPMPTDGDPRSLLKYGRALLAQNKHEEADKVCSQLLTSKARWGLFEDTPEKLRRDIVRSRQSWERDEAVRLMAEARKQFAKGELDDAEKKAYQAQKYHGPYGMFDFGVDRPQKLLEEIQRTRQAKGLPNPIDKGKEIAGVKDNANKIAPPPADVPAGIQNANKNRAIVMIREARELERQGMLYDARLKAFEARDLKARFAPDEDSPDNVLGSLNAKCDRQIVAHLQKAYEHANSANDPQRFEKAQEQVLAARKLAHAFELDSSRIDLTQQHLQKIASGSMPVSVAGGVSGLLPSPNPIDPPTGDPAKDLLRKKAREKLQLAQVELSYGKTAQARKMAEELYRPEYGIQEDVLRLIRSISAEEYNQQILEAKRTFDAGLDAFLHEDFRKAMAIFERIDPLQLPDQYQQRLRDIMSTRQMQPQSVMQAQYKKLPVRGAPIDAQPTDVAVEPNLMETVKAQEMVRFQALRQRGQDALRSASDLYKADHKDEAIETLNRYLGQVNEEQLSDQKMTNELKRLPEQRIQQFRAMLNEEKLKTLQGSGQYASIWNEAGNQKKIRERQLEVADKMKVVTELMKQNKLKDAEVECKKIREIDPENLAVVAALSIISIKREQENYDRQVHGNEEIFLRELDVGLGRVATMKNPVLFENKEASARREKNNGAITHERLGPKEKAIEYRLRQPISLNFRDVPLEKAIETLTVLSGVQVMADKSALKSASVNLESPLTFAVDNISMKSALNLMLKQVNLTYTIENEVLLITTPENTIGRLVRVTYPIADLIVVVPDFQMPDVLNMVKMLEMTMRQPAYYQQSGGQQSFPLNQGDTVSTQNGNGLGSTYSSHKGGAQGQTGGTQGNATKTSTKEAMAEVLKQLIQDTIAKNSWEAMGGTGNIQYFPFGMALVINQPQEVQEEVALLLATLRRLQDLQVSVELRAVVVSETFFERIGVDFEMNIQAPKRAGTAALIAGDIPTATQKGAISGMNAAGSLTPDLGFPIGSHSFNFTTPVFGGYQPTAGLSLGLAFLSDIQVFMFLEAVQGDRRAHVMQAPKITVFNGQQANISGTVSRPVTTSLNPFPTPDGNVIMVPNTVALPFGLGMTVQPVVSPDRRFIRLNVSPQIGAGIIDPAGAVVQAFPGGINNPPLANNPLNVQVQINPGASSLQIVNTTVNVPDGGTVLLGGFKFLAEERTEYGPPVLSKIPYLSRLFRNVGWSRDGATLIYLVTARVIMVEEEERIFLGLEPAIPGR